MSLFGAQPTFGQPTALAPTSTAATSFFGQPSSQPNFFQQPQNVQNPPPAFGTGTSLFGQPAQSQASIFGAPSTATSTFSFGAPTNVSAGTSLFAQPSSTNFLSTANPNFSFSQNPPPKQVSQTSNNLETIRNFTSALTAPQIYGDERDIIIARFNQLQAFCGSGKGYFNSNYPPMEFTGENSCCRLKTVCFNRLSGWKDEDGLVTLVIKKPETEVKNSLQLIIDALFKMMGARPQLGINVETTKPLPENNCELVLFVTETSPTGHKKRISASETYNFLNQPSIKQQLITTLSVEQMVMKVDLSPDKMKEYIALPQAGIDSLLWQQAVADNPDPAHLIPYPVVGFSGVRERQKMQKIENQTHDECLKELSSRIERVDEKLVASRSKLIEMKSRENQLSHRLIKVISMQLIQARQGYALESNEESLNSRLEAVNSVLNGSSHLKSRIAEILSHFRSRDDNFRRQLDNVKGQLDDDVVLELKQYLRKCQDAAEKLISVVKQDAKDLAVIKEVMNTVETSAR